MPCRYDEPEPDTRQLHLQRSAKLLIFVKTRLQQRIPAWLEAQASSRFADDERCVTDLCALLKGMSDVERDRLIYDARDRDSRDLADWWEDHLREDAAREAREEAERERQDLRARGLSKLTEDERRALGIK